MPGSWSATAGALGAGTDGEVDGTGVLGAEVLAGGVDVGVAAPADAAPGAEEQLVSASIALKASTVHLTVMSHPRPASGPRHRQSYREGPALRPSVAPRPPPTARGVCSQSRAPYGPTRGNRAR